MKSKGSVHSRLVDTPFRSAGNARPAAGVVSARSVVAGSASSYGKSVSSVVNAAVVKNADALLDITVGVPEAHIRAFHKFVSDHRLKPSIKPKRPHSAFAATYVFAGVPQASVVGVGFPPGVTVTTSKSKLNLG